MTDMQHPGDPSQPTATPPAAPFGPPIPPKKRSKLPWIAGGVAALVLLCCGIGAIGAAVDNTKKPTAADATPTTVATPTAAPTTTAPSPTPAAPTTPAKTSPPPKPKPVVYAKLTDRQWKLVAKNPDSYVGDTYIVYGQVTQFDAATGVDTFRANVGARNMPYEFDYDTNTLMQGDAAKLRNLVGDDEFQAKVTVLGSFTYDTQIGGSTTVPLLRVDWVKVL